MSPDFPLARKLAGSRVKEIAQHFKREPMTISLGVKRVENLLQRDRDFSKRPETMEMNPRGKSKKKYLITIDPFPYGEMASFKVQRP
jgi:hypothetical protein